MKSSQSAQATNEASRVSNGTAGFDEIILGGLPYVFTALAEGIVITPNLIGLTPPVRKFAGTLS